MTTQPTEPIAATVAQMAWLSGRWVGTRDGDEIEETWSAAAGTAMVGMFRAIRDGAPRFYELLTLDTEGDGLVFRFRHFERDLSAWEEKDDPLVLDLVALSDTDAVFLRRGTRRWMTYRRTDPEHLAVFFENEGEGHDPQDEYRFARR